MSKYRWERKKRAKRVRSDAGWVDPEQLPKGPNGRALCRYCGTEIPEGLRKTFCSDACVHDWKIQTQPAYCARELEKRDHGVCALCGIDTVIERQKAAKDPLWYIREAPNPQFAKRPPWPKSTYRRWWEDHHVIAVRDGGAGCALDLHATVCVPCHKKVTKKQRHGWKQGKIVEADLFLPGTLTLFTEDGTVIKDRNSADQVGTGRGNFGTQGLSVGNGGPLLIPYLPMKEE